MKKLASFCSVLYLLWSLPVGAQTVTNGGLSGTVVSRSVAANGSDEATIYTTPKKGHFVLTQIGSVGASFTATGFGEIGITDEAEGLQPLTFIPGIALPPQSSIQCLFNGNVAPSYCIITGVLEK